MPRRLLYGPSDQPERSRGTIGGYERVARRFLPACPASKLIWLNGHGRGRALDRRRLARLIDLRRVVS